MPNTREEQLKVREEHPDTFVAVDPGDALTGELVSVKRAWSDARTNNGRNPERGNYPLLTVRNDQGELIKFHAFSTVAENEVLQARALPGERVRITYLGVSQNAKKGQNPAKLFSFEVSGRSAAVAATSVYESLSNPPRVTQPAAPATPTPSATDFEPTQDALDDDIPF